MAVGDAQCFKVLSLSKKEKYRVPTLPLINYCFFFPTYKILYYCINYYIFFLAGSMQAM